MRVSSSLVLAWGLGRALPALAFTTSLPSLATPSRWARVRGGGLQSTTTEEPPVTETEGETFEFQAEVSRVMDIIINSLYQDKDVFLRELVSNAADACDKRRFLALTDGQASDEMSVKVTPDKEANTLTIEDEGIGMTKEELINNLGRIAQSGTKKFMEALGQGNDDVNLIGQFGVGFYSGYLVADKMTVVSKSAQSDDSIQYKWESQAGSSFTIIEDKDGKPFPNGAGTRITLHLKEDCDEYTDKFKMREMLRKYSSFIQFPIKLWAEKTDYKQVPDLDAEVVEGEEPKMKTESVTTTDWELMNQQKPIWLRSPKDVNDTEYEAFYKSTFRAYDTPMAHTHFSLEGQVEFKALLYVPSVVPFELNRDMFNEASKAVKLYVKRVFINDKFEELMPRWLTFVRGIVDSEDLPLNVGREILQKSKMLTVINKRLVRKSIDMFKDIEQNGEGEYLTFWNNFGKYLKVGIIEDPDNKDDLAKLCRFFSTKSGEADSEGVGGVTSLEAYVGRMAENQTAIYYVTGDSKASAARSPVLEKLKALDIEVLFLTEPLDELTVQSLDTFGDNKLIDTAKGDLDLPVDDETKQKKEEATKDLEEVCDWLKSTLAGKVTKVDISTLLTDSPSALVQGAYGMSPTMQRYMKAQAVASGQDDMMNANMNQATMELNPDHPITLQLKSMVEASPDAAETKSFGTLMYDVAALAGGYSIDDPSEFAARITKMMGGSAPQPAAKKSEPVEAEEVKAEVAEEVSTEAEPDADSESDEVTTEIV